MNYFSFSVAPVKVRILFIKKLLNKLGYNLDESFKEDKQYKKALKDYQVKNGYGGNCIVSENVFKSFIEDVPEAIDIWKSMK